MVNDIHRHQAHLLLMARDLVATRVAAFDPSEPRDEQGRWTAGDVKLSEKAVKEITARAVGGKRRVVNLDALTKMTDQDLDDLQKHYDLLSKARGSNTARLSAQLAKRSVADEVKRRQSPRALSSRYPVRQAADHLEPTFSVAIRAAFAVARKKLPNELAVTRALEGALEKVLPGLLRRGLVAGGEAATLVLRTSGLRVAADSPFTMQFNAKAPNVIAWAKKHAAELVTEIVETTRQRLADAVVRHTEGTIDDEAFSDALESAVGDEDRAQTIARTESMMAVHQGQREAWDQAVDDGLLPEDAKRTWIVTDDDKLCPICEPLDGETADLDGEYVDSIEAPPAHPNCRCTEGIA